MSSYKCVIFGQPYTGKSHIANSIMAEKAYETYYIATIGAAYLIKELNGNKIGIWDLSGDEAVKTFRPTYFKNSAVGLYCIDLSKEIDEDAIAEDIEEFKQVNPNGSVCLVGTKADLCKEDAQEKLNGINIEGVTSRIVTSAKEYRGINELINLLLPTTKAVANSKEKGRVLSQWVDAIDNLRKAMKDLPRDQRDSIEHEISVLEQNLNNEHHEIHVKSIENFKHNCLIILEGEHPHIIKAVFTVIMVAIVILIAGLIGFGIGFAAGAWTGPGAFISGLLAGSAAATSVAVASGSLGLMSGGYTGYCLFKKSSEINAVDQFVGEIEKSELAVA